MGLAFLPWERLPAYILGPIVFALCGGLLYGDAHRTPWSIFCEVGGIVFAVWLVVQRYRTGKEPLADPKKSNSSD